MAGAILTKDEKLSAKQFNHEWTPMNTNRVKQMGSAAFTPLQPELR